MKYTWATPLDRRCRKGKLMDFTSSIGKCFDSFDRTHSHQSNGHWPHRSQLNFYFERCIRHFHSIKRFHFVEHLKFIIENYRLIKFSPAIRCAQRATQWKNWAESVAGKNENKIIFRTCGIVWIVTKRINKIMSKLVKRHHLCALLLFNFQWPSFFPIIFSESIQFESITCMHDVRPVYRVYDNDV